MKNRSIMLIALSLLALPTVASAYSITLTGDTSGGIVRWGTSNVSYHLHPDCSVDLPTSSCLQEVRDSFDQWSASCANIQFIDQGFSNTKQLTATGYSGNGKNELAWIEDGQWVYGSYVLGLTAPYFSVPSGEISEADIAFNGYQHTWSMSGENYSTDVMNVAVHEIGHFFGLQHVLAYYDPEDPPTMATTADNFMKSRTPEQDDLDGLCFLYPAPGWSCQTNEDCPTLIGDGPQGEYYLGQLACSGGQCGGFSNEVPEGTAGLGEACSGDLDCIDPYFCQPLNTGGICTLECQTASPNCPAGFECVGYSNSPGLGVCLEASGSGTSGPTKELGEPCNSSLECYSQLCLNVNGTQVCKQPCSTDANCPAGESCDPIPGTNYGACSPDDGGTTTGPGKPVGADCSSSEECESGLCAGDGSSYLCTAWCTSNADCPAGYECLGLQGGGGGCFEADALVGLGGPCDYSNECESQLCVAFEGNDGVCSDSCPVGGNTCPCGMACLEYTDGGYCTPGEKVACVPDGEACSADSECTSGTCWEGECLLTCSIFQGSSPCPAGETCQQLAEGMTLGTCMPAGPNPLGGACGQHNACETLYCYEYYCEQPCQPSGPPTCPTGQVCEDTGGAVGICVTPPEPEPEPEPEPQPDPEPEPGNDNTGTPSPPGEETDNGNTSVDPANIGTGTGTSSADGDQTSSGDLGDGGTTTNVSVGCQGSHTTSTPPALILWLVLSLGLWWRRRSTVMATSKG